MSDQVDPAAEPVVEQAPAPSEPPESGARFRRQLAAVVVVGLLVRLLLVLVYRADELTGDEVDYHRLAFNVARHGTYGLELEPPIHPSVFRPPLALLWLAGHIAVFGDTMWPIYVSQSLVGLAAAIWLGLAVRRRAPELGLWPTWLLSVVPFGAIYASQFMTESLTIALVSSSLAAILWFPPRRAAVVGGLLLGLASLSRDIFAPLALFLPLGVAAFARWTAASPRYGAREVALSVALSALVIAPWTARNVSVGLPTVISKGGAGIALWIGTWERNDTWQDKGMIWPEWAFVSPEEKATVNALTKVDEAGRAARDNVFRELAVARIKARPAHTLGIWLIRGPRLWIGSRSEMFTPRYRFVREGVGRLAVKGAGWIGNLLILALGLVGAVLAVRRRHPLALLLAPIALTGLVYFPFHSSESRYSEPVFPFIIVLAIFGGAHLLHVARGRLAT